MSASPTVMNTARNTKWNHVLVVASCRHETLDHHHNTRVFLYRRKATKIQVFHAS